MKIAIVHDMAESIVGDFTPHCNVTKEEKYLLEKKGIEDIQQILGVDSEGAIEVGELWNEYEKGETPAAKIVKDLDKLEMILQAHEYEKTQGAQLQEFFDSTQNAFKTEIGNQWAEEVRLRRQNGQQNGYQNGVSDAQ
eukprot:TRINITY_DN10094_c0_g2_i1.p1 TRINITY_DN10094_c0_g2~~TRINITY_DN10094_c0_g2_i1.p1  ORF type:complete len:138 (-),score=35.59 TRINITY_DN10094_c0_g2_i1:358-771(-)